MVGGKYGTTVAHGLRLSADKAGSLVLPAEMRGSGRGDPAGAARGGARWLERVRQQKREREKQSHRRGKEKRR